MGEVAEMVEIATWLFEIMGTIAFAVSGAMVGIEKKMDILGVCILGVVTAVGGGVIRDLVLGNTPPQSFRDPIYINIAIVSSIVIFLPQIRQMFAIHPKMYGQAIFWMDAIGLGVFTVVGSTVALTKNPDAGMFLAVFVGVVTGVGGGVIRDMLAGNTPFILEKDFYATASLLGGILFVILWRTLDSLTAMAIGILAVVLLRMMAVHFGWKLPLAKEILEDVD